MPIVGVVVVGTGGLIALAVGVALALGLGTAATNTQGLWAEQADTLIESMQVSLAEQLEPVAQQGEWIASRVASGALDLRDLPGLDQFIAGALGATPQVAGIAVVYASGQSRRWGRADTRRIDEDWSARNVIRLWLEGGRNRRQASWQSPFWTPTLDTTVLLHDAPLLRNGEFLGMLAQVVPVKNVSMRLAREYAASGLVPFVLYGRDRVLAHPLLQDLTGEPVEDASALPALDELGDPILSRIWSPDDSAPEVMRGLTRSHAAVVHQEGGSYLLLFRTLSQFGPQPWTIGAYLDMRQHGAREQRRIVLAAGAGLAVLLLAVTLASVVGTRLSHRIRDLAAAARRIEEGAIAVAPTFASSGVREIDDAAGAFQLMITGLRERDLIRDTLGRFVPAEVARHLLDEGGRLEPRESAATVLFCDIEGFTGLTESVGSHETVAILNAYFSEMVAILERHGGVATQFQGDAILATFNVPIADPRHAANALSAALEMLRSTGIRRFAGERLRIRIGVNTGLVVAGAVGAAGRLSYTVHGEAVNLAARLESLNKAYGTRVLASEHTVALVEGFALREIGVAEIRGVSRRVKIFEVLGSDQCQRQQ